MEIGTKVWIHALGSYYAGEVVKLTEKRAIVRYTSGAAVIREKAVPYNAELGIYAEKYATRFPLVPLLEGVLAPRGARQLSTAEKGPNIYEQAQAARGRS